jgi:peptidoglycan/xylan/chitin deacetylase (PgdA/CDA1 family)
MQTLALMYHDVVPGRRFESSGFQSPDANRYKLELDEFRRHMEIIAGFPQRRVLLTFDDGGISALQTAEILEQFGAKGFFFVTTDRIASPGFLNESQIRDLRGRGHLVGSHSCSHPRRMSRCSPEVLDREWSDSVRELETILGEPVHTASVPGGYYCRDVAAAAARAGIRELFTSEPVTTIGKVDGCLVLGRFAIQRGLPEHRLRSLVAGRIWPRLECYALWNARKFLKAVGGESWLALRAFILARREPKEAAPHDRFGGAGR